MKHLLNCSDADNARTIAAWHTMQYLGLSDKAERARLDSTRKSYQSQAAFHRKASKILRRLHPKSN